ncbi:TspO/MBR family protein [Pseudoclavibacter helvolus]
MRAPGLPRCVRRTAAMIGAVFARRSCSVTSFVTRRWYARAEASADTSPSWSMPPTNLARGPLPDVSTPTPSSVRSFSFFGMPPDLLRRLFVTVSGILCVIGTLFGVGLFGGTEVNQSSSGNLAADATLIAPAGTAFSIWSVIYIGLFAYVIWQWLPKQTTSAKARATGWLAALSMLLNAGWLLVTQFGLIWVSVGVIVALLVVCIMLVSRIAANPAESWGERLAVDTTFGLYLGWYRSRRSRTSGPRSFRPVWLRRARSARSPQWRHSSPCSVSRRSMCGAGRTWPSRRRSSGASRGSASAGSRMHPSRRLLVLSPSRSRCSSPSPACSRSPSTGVALTPRRVSARRGVRTPLLECS